MSDSSSGDVIVSGDEAMADQATATDRIEMLSAEASAQLRQGLNADEGNGYLLHIESQLEVWRRRGRYARSVVLLQSNLASTAQRLEEAEADLSGSRRLLDSAMVENARLVDAVASVSRERDAYRKAKSENDERFMNERDEAREEVARLRGLLDAERDGANALVYKAQQAADALRVRVRELEEELGRMQRVCDEALPREYLECPKCQQKHVDGENGVEFATRPHHTHRCQHCDHVWDNGRWSFGADVPKQGRLAQVVVGDGNVQSGGSIHPGAFSLAGPTSQEAQESSRKSAIAALLDARKEVDGLRADLKSVAQERDRLQRACDEGLPREYLECPRCNKQHIEAMRHDNPSVDGRTRPHHTHRCYHCTHVWDNVRWSFGADVPKPEEHERPVQVVAAVAVRGGKVLLVQARHGVATPGGKVRAGESHETALRREVLEETGLEIVKFGRYLGSDVRRKYHCHLYAVEVAEAQPVAGDDAAAAWWGDPCTLLTAPPSQAAVPASEYRYSRDYPLVLDVLANGIGDAPHPDKTWHELSVELTAQNALRSAWALFEGSPVAPTKEEMLRHAQTGGGWLVTWSMGGNLLGEVVFGECRGYDLDTGNMGRRWLRLDKSGTPISRATPLCRCALPGPQRGCRCRAEGLRMRFASDEWCDCPCHMKGSI